LFAGALHDIGKALLPLRVLGKTDEWTALDQRIMQRHVLDGYRLLRDRFDFSGEVMLWHHRFQVRGYPKRLPPPLHRYSTATRVLIMEYGRLLALADVYDALHRSNSRSKHGGLSAEEIKEKMLEYNPDRRPLIHALYASGVLE
jgi:HD-GYP domain-containing protein (c-di-GMP phosphodiesterase class II)